MLLLRLLPLLLPIQVVVHLSRSFRPILIRMPFVQFRAVQYAFLVDRLLRGRLLLQLKLGYQFPNLSWDRLLLRL